jgi:Rad3-related DNA helicase
LIDKKEYIIKMKWSLYNEKGILDPLLFSNGKSQLDIAKEVIEAVNQGNKVIFIKGVCGTGKSAIALNIAKEMGRASIVVPVKTLQKQYQDDYSNELHILKDNNEKLKITVIDGRINHKCPFKGNGRCDSKDLPCTIEIKQENVDLIKRYVKENPFFKFEDFMDIDEIKRKSVAPACAYWSPIICKELFDYYLKDATRIEYKGLKNKTFVYHKRKEGCSYYDQFMSYINSDVIIFNSRKYELETLMDRKPATEVEIIDECDEFLDSLSAEKKINLSRLSRKLSSVGNPNLKELCIEINDLLMEIIENRNLEKNKIFLIKETRIFDLLRCFLDNPEIIDQTEEEISNYFYTIYETGKAFENFFDETYVTFYKNKYEDLIATVVTINLEKKLKEFLDKNKVFVMMGGTIHSPEVLKNIFGIKEFKVIEAETRFRGKIMRIKSGFERAFNHVFLKQEGSRELYLKALSRSIEIAKRPVLVHVNSFADLPNNFECSVYGIKNLKTAEELEIEQEKYKRGELLQKFKSGEIDVFYSTKCSRGVDLPGELCNSIVFTKYPYPNIDSLFWKVLKKSKPEHFSLFYFDKARREFIQRVYRGVRSEEDSVDLLSPDLRVLNFNGL